MTLDWEPLPKAKKGQEAEFADLFHKLESARGTRQRDRLFEWFTNASIPAYTLLGAPRVGFDPDADEWLRKRVEKQQRTSELEAIQKEMHGYTVLQLLPASDGFPVYSNYLTNESLDRYSFNGALVIAERELVGDDLWHQLQVAQLPDALAEVAMGLHEIAQKFAVDHKLPDHVETVRQPIFPEGTPERRCHVVFAAAKWATFWSHRGHGMMVL